MTKQVFQMPNKHEDVDAMVLTLKGAAEDILEQEAQVRFEICVSEALANLILHADFSDSAAPSEIALALTEDRVHIEIFDPVGSNPFDLRDHAVPLADVEITAENGRGLGLILECADSVTYGPSGQRNRLQLSFLNRLENEQDA